eukprot:TRINITY_DN4542_c0_g1_i3.p1 TRINITY_DN4542_c0_g1~~TRINITY_DN4542_c0_g1_i3.p1  ORF type:complete len:207 (-),score=21.29 TRINITY_DN4542_c0_g1_i3:81-701(-)
MHNGSTPHWCRVKQYLTSYLSAKSFERIEGTTDSEFFGAMFVDQLPGGDPSLQHSPNDIKLAILKTLCIINNVVRNIERKEKNLNFSCCSLNFGVTDGHTVIATRFRDHPEEEPPSLYYTRASKYEVLEDDVEITPCTEKDCCCSVIVASEPLTYCQKSWTLVPKNHLVHVNGENLVTVEPIILDEGPVNCCYREWLSDKDELSPC